MTLSNTKAVAGRALLAGLARRGDAGGEFLCRVEGFDEAEEAEEAPRQVHALAQGQDDSECCCRCMVCGCAEVQGGEIQSENSGI